jgi:hypothetical protein
VENGSHDFLWITGISGIISQKKLLDEDLVKLGVDTVIGDNLTSLHLTPLKQNKERAVVIVISSNFYAH